MAAPANDKPNGNGGANGKNANGKHAGGAPSKYDPARHPTIAAALYRSGYTDAQTAELLGIHTRTLQRWADAHSEFRRALKEGKDPADERVEKSLFQNAVGYEYEEETIIAKRVPVKGKPGEYTESIAEIKRTKKHQAPTTMAQVFWLCNRAPGRWRDVKQVLVGGDGGTPVNINVSAREELAGLIARLAARAGAEGGAGEPERGGGEEPAA